MTYPIEMISFFASFVQLVEYEWRKMNFVPEHDTLGNVFWKMLKQPELILLVLLS